jgi:hypothetical protein
MLRTNIKNHLKTKGSITRLEAIGLYSCMDITTVIRDLRRGNNIRKAMKIYTHIKVDNNGKRYARYSTRSRVNP